MYLRYRTFSYSRPLVLNEIGQILHNNPLVADFVISLLVSWAEQFFVVGHKLERAG